MNKKNIVIGDRKVPTNLEVGNGTGDNGAGGTGDGGTGDGGTGDGGDGGTGGTGNGDAGGAGGTGDGGTGGDAGGTGDGNGNGDAGTTSIVIEEDGAEVTYSLNATGDAINEAGEVVYTAAQLAEFEAGNDGNDTGITVADISKASGIQVLDEQGNPIVHEMTVEGLAQREVDIRKQAIREGYQTYMEQLKHSNPGLADVIEYYESTGSISGYGDYVDYSKITINKDDESQMLDIIEKAEIAKGTSPDRAKKIANYSKVDGTVFADASDALKFLETRQNTAKTERDNANAARVAAEIAAENDYFGVSIDKTGKLNVLDVEGSVYDKVVKKGIIKGLAIPKDGITVKNADNSSKRFSREDIFDYIYKPAFKDNAGNVYTKAEYDEMQRMENKDELIYTYIRNLLGDNIDTLISSAKLQDKANNVRRIVVTSKQTRTPQPSGGGNKKIVKPFKQS